MTQIGACGVVWRTLRGVVAMVGLAACSGAGTATQTPGNPTAAPDVALLQGTWAVVSLQEAGKAATSAPEGRFIADFGVDGDLYIQADCNVCSAGYEATDDGAVAVVGPIPCTLAFCPTAPLDSRYVSLLESARTWSVGSGSLELSSAEGVLVLSPTRP